MLGKVNSYANTSGAIVSVANPNLNGTGTFVNVISSPGASITGTKVHSIFIKAIESTSQGVIRLFIDNGSVKNLLEEILVPAITQSGVVKSFEYLVSREIYLDPGYSILATTQVADSFVVLANAENWKSCECTSSNNPIRSYAKTGVTLISEANGSLNGSGTLGTVLTSPTGGSIGGTQVNAVEIKATGSTSQGMIRLFIYDGTTKFLVTEIPIPSNSQTNTVPAFRTLCYLGIYLSPGYSLMASTEENDEFNIFTFAQVMDNCPC